MKSARKLQTVSLKLLAPFPKRSRTRLVQRATQCLLACALVSLTYRMQDFRNLRVWQAAHKLSLDVIRALPERACRRVPGLRSQAIRAATSVPWNIAEGCKRSSQREFLQFLGTALSSLGELEAQLITARDEQLFRAAVYSRLQASVVVVRRMLISLSRKVERDLAKEQPTEPNKRKSRESGDVAADSS